MAHVLSLPTETVLLILELASLLRPVLDPLTRLLFTRDAYPLLRAASLVCRSWRPIAQRLLARRVSLEPNKRHRALNSALLARAQVHHLILDDQSPDSVPQQEATLWEQLITHVGPVHRLTLYIRNLDFRLLKVDTLRGEQHTLWSSFIIRALTQRFSFVLRPRGARFVLCQSRLLDASQHSSGATDTRSSVHAELQTYRPGHV